VVTLIVIGWAIWQSKRETSEMRELSAAGAASGGSLTSGGTITAK
jgi:hypothetical protein